MPTETYADLLKLVEQHCTIDQIKALLRRAKSRLSVEKTDKGRKSKNSRQDKDAPRAKVSAEDKSALINSNLVDALKTRAIHLSDVYDLLRRGEENGDQHIFYYAMKRDSVSKTRLKIESVGEALLGTNWQAKVPRASVPAEYDVADLRGSENDWTLKLYGHEVARRYGEIQIINGRPYIPVLEEPIRSVLVARWRQPDLLELRVPRNSSWRRVAAWRQRLWDKIEKAGLQPVQFTPWDLSAVRRALIEREHEGDAAYSTRDTRLANDKYDSRATFEGQAEAYDLFARLEVDDAIRTLLKAGDECVNMSVKWHRVKNSFVPSREIQTVVGGRESNEVVILGQCEPADVDYITKKLRQARR